MIILFYLLRACLFDFIKVAKFDNEAMGLTFYTLPLKDDTHWIPAIATEAAMKGARK